MRTIGKTIGYLLWIGAGIFMFIFWLSAMSKWLGTLGIILSFVLCPSLVVFPIIVWAIGIVGLIISGLSSGND